MRQPYPPEYDYPEPECEVCGSFEVTEESIENATALCEDHDTEIARERFHLELGIEIKSEALAHISMDMTPDQPDEKLERLQKQHSDTGSELRKLRQRLRDLQDRCDHENASRSKDVYEESDLENVPEDEMPDELPVTIETVICWECGLQEQRSDW